MFQVALKWFQRIGKSKPISGRELQLRSETFLLYSIATGKPLVGKSLPEALAVAADRVLTANETPFEEQAMTVKTFLQSKIVRCLSTLHDDDCTQSTSSSFQPSYVPEVDISTIPNAGLGLHVRGKAERGDLIALYPGLCYLPSDLKHLPDFPRISENNEYLTWRYDGIVIDGKSALKQDFSKIKDQANDVLKHDTEHKLAAHRFSLGHRVNHPPPGEKPNCLQFMVNISETRDTFPIRSMVPNVLFTPEKSGLTDRLLNLSVRQRVPSCAAFGSITRTNSTIPTLAIIAAKEIEDEEVFINYRFNPKAPDIPSWYDDCDPASTERRWAETGILRR